MISMNVRAFVSLLVIFITVEIHGRHVGMSMKKIRQEVYNALKQDSLITSDEGATATDDGENFVEETSPRSSSPHIDINSPSTERKFKLFNKLGSQLAVTADGVKGSKESNARDTVLLVQTVGVGVAVMFKGIQADQYVCMEKDTGILYASKKKSLECVFMESMTAKGWFHYHAFLHRKDKSKWYLGIDEDGEVLDGDESKRTDDETKFMRVGRANGIAGFGSGRY